MKKYNEIAKTLVWVAFVIFTFLLFVSDFKHTHSFPNEDGKLQELFENFDFQLKFLAYVLIFIPLLVFTFLRHSLVSKVAYVLLPLLLCVSYYNLSYAFEEEGYFFYQGNDYAGYFPHVGFYFVALSALLLLVAGILKSLTPIERLKKRNQSIIDDF